MTGPEDPEDDDEIDAPDEDEVEGEEPAEEHDEEEAHGLETQGQKAGDAGQDGGLKPSRAQSRIRTLADELKAERERGAQRDRELAEIRAQSQRSQQRGESREEREARLALMDPEQRSEYRLNEALEQNRRDMAAMQFQMQDAADRSGFQARAATDKLYAKWGAKVEEELSKLRAQGQNVGREQLFKYLVGEAALAARGKAGKTARQEGQKRIQRQTTKPLNSRGDAGGARRRSEASLEERLADVEI